MRVNGSKLVIVSSGFTKVIQLWFEIHGFDLDGITIYANEFLFAENGVASEIVGITRSPLDKFAEIDFQSKNFDSTIVIGDSLEDLPPP